MSDVPSLILALLVGASLGAIFFGGLWLTVQKGVRSERPALWFLGSLSLRTFLVLAGFHWVARDHWSRFAACLSGFLIARVVVVRRLSRTSSNEHVEQETVAHHAHQSR